MASDNDEPFITTKPKRRRPISDSESSDDSMIRTNRRRRFKVVSDVESSDDDNDFPKPIVKRKNHKLHSDEESWSESSSDSETINTSNLIESGDSAEWQSDWDSGDDTETQNIESPDTSKEEDNNKLTKMTTESSNYDSDKSDGQTEKCPICLLPFKKQQLGTPSSCDHSFCFECILEWSKNINTCPVDRTNFVVINIRKKLGGKIIKHVPVEVKPAVEDMIVEDPTFCEICHNSDREDRMLLCDGCDLGYHLECLNPPMTHVPIEEWFCPDCAHNIQLDAETVEMDIDEINDLMEEARRLGVSYGRTRSAYPQDNIRNPRLIPRTSQTERVRANVRAHLRPSTRPQHEPAFNPDQPSTSSGMDSISENSHSRSPETQISSRVLSTISRSRPSTGSRGRKKKHSTKKHKSKKSNSKMKRVVIKEINQDGEEEEIVTYVKMSASSSKKKGGKKRKKSRKKWKRRLAMANAKTVKRRLARTLGIHTRGVRAVIPTLKNGQSAPTERTMLINSRYNAGISQVSLFGNNLGLGYSPPGSDEEFEGFTGNGPIVQTQPRVMNATRRRMALKGIRSPPHSAAPTDPLNLIESIMNSQELWHSCKNSNVTLKADGTLLIKNKENEHSINNCESPVKKKEEKEKEQPSGDNKPLDMSNNITQAPMYNSSRGGGNRGHFRGGYRENNRHSYGGQNYNSHDSYSGGGGRHSYGGSGNSREFGNATSNYEPRGPMPFGGNVPFRNRNPQHFRNRFPGPENADRLPFAFQEQQPQHRFPQPRMPLGIPPGPPPGSPPNLPNALGPVAPPPLMSIDFSRAMPMENFDVPEPVESSEHTENDEECDIYSDIQAPSKSDMDTQEEGGDVLLPPPEPPSGLLDFEESKSERDNDSDQELVIDDTPKEETAKDGAKDGEKYDPFDDSESNDSRPDKAQKDHKGGDKPANIPIPIEPPPSLPNYSGLNLASQEKEKEGKQPQVKSLMRLTAYDDEDEEDSQSDCPNFSIYSSQTMDVARHSEQEMSQMCPLEPPPLPPSIPDDDDIIVGDVQACDLADIPEPVDPYVEALRKERQTLSKIPSKKISHDARGKITFKIENTKMKLNCKKLSNLYDEIDENIEISIEQEKQTKKKEDDEPKDQSEAPRKSEDHDIWNLEKEAVTDNVEDSVKLDNKRVVEKEEEDEILPKDEEEKDESEIGSDRMNRLEDEDSEIMEKDAEIDSENLTPPLERSLTPRTETYTPDRLCEDDDSESMKTEETAEKSATDEAIILSDDDSQRRDETGMIITVKDDDEEQSREKMSSIFEVDDDSENFPLEKDKADLHKVSDNEMPQVTWESDGAYTPCKDELPVKDVSPLLESGLEPITPTKDISNDDLDGCRTPAGYAGLGTEAISETDEAMNFEDELGLLSSKKAKDKDKDMEEGEIMDESMKAGKLREKAKLKEDDKKRKKKDKKEKSKEVEKNKENISSENLVSWKKISKSTKERQYRDKDKRSRSREKEKDKERPRKKSRELAQSKRKEKRKELPRYDVRKLVAEKPRKDEYGRDIRDTSRSLSRSVSRVRRSRSYSRGRSRSRSQESWGRGCRSLSRRKSASRSRHRVARKRSISRKRSPSRRRSISRRKSRSASRRRRSLSPRRRSPSPRRRSQSPRRRSLSPRRKSRRRSVSRDRKRKSRSRSIERRKKKQHRSRSRSKNRKRSRSRSAKRSRDKKHSKVRRSVIRSRSRSPAKRSSLSREGERNRNWEPINDKVIEREPHYVPNNREERDSWSAQWTPSWSRSRSKTPPVQQSEMVARDWSPPPAVLNDVPPKNLTVILTNKEAIKKKKKEKRKDGKKVKEVEKRGKRNRRPRNVPLPSKEVFASGDNILVSVCFNKENETSETPMVEIPETIPLITPGKRRRRETTNVEPPAKKNKKDKAKEKRSKSPKAKKDKKKKSKAAEIAASKKPVAVIDLDQSPFREQTPSPRDVIVLSDDDDEKQAQARAGTPERLQTSAQTTPQHDQFVSQGPKTPPEPQVKFSINKQTNNLRPSMMNPLLEEEEEEEEEEQEADERAEEELEMRAQEELELRLKIGPNTPPEPPSSPQTSPDAYDPFDPTKSRSPTPVVSQEATPLTDERNQRNSPRKHDGAEASLTPVETPQQQEQQPPEKQPDKPKIISMVTIKRASPVKDSTPVVDSQTEAAQVPESSPSKIQQNQQSAQSTANSFPVINPVLATVAAAVQRSSIFTTGNTIAAQRNLMQTNRISPSNQAKQQRTNDRPQLPNIFANSIKSASGGRVAKAAQNKNSSAMGQNGNDANADAANDTIDMSSPYSPGSSLSDGIFDPPSPGNGSPAAATAAAPSGKTNSAKSKSDAKKDLFDSLFESSPVVRVGSGKGKSKKMENKKKKQCSYQTMSYASNAKVGVRMDENQLQILDDLPSSAVEMQVKDKFLKKLNRQERVVEEVKLVLKPHYTKKHVTKEEYKDIMRKAVPKICHNKSGEINPKKIAQLIEAYVKKCRNVKKRVGTNPAAKMAKPIKSLWS